MLTAAFDLDETFLHSKDAMAQILLEETGVLVAPSTWKSYDLAKVWMDSGLVGDRVILNSEVMGWFTKHNLFERCQLQDGSFEVYEFCRRRNIPMEFVTARGFDPAARQRTSTMLRLAGIRAGYDLTIVDHLLPKQPHMKNGKPTLFVDDNAVQVLHMREYATYSLLMAQPHNEAFRKDRERHPHLVQTVHSMWDVLDVLTHINAQSCLADAAL